MTRSDLEELTKLPSDVKWRHEMTMGFASVQHRWYVMGPSVTIDVWITEYADPKYPINAGVELHSRTPLSHTAPSHEKCPAFNGGGPCWHDGSSLQGDPYIEVWNACGHNVEAMMLMVVRGERLRALGTGYEAFSEEEER